MTKAELIAKVAKDAEISKKTASTAVDAVIDGIKGAVKGGENVTLVGFGTFKLTQRMAREGRNPRTGKKINIPASKVVKFSPGKAFKEMVNGAKKKKK